MKLLNTKLMVGALLALGAVASIVFASASNAAVHTTPDCSSNAIIKCGVSSSSDLKSKFNNSSELQRLYAHFGWTKSVINNAKFVNGIVYANGTIKVGNKTVATGAQSIGRNINSGSGCNGSPFKVSGKTYYTGTTKCRFGTYTAQPVLVMLDANGQFIGAINKTCGNPHPAKPVPVPVYACSALTANKVSRNEYKFTAKATAKNGAKIKSYSFNFGDGTTKNSTSNSVSHTYAKAGTYTVKVVVTFTANGKTVTDTNSHCATKVTIAPAPVYACENLKYNQVSRTEFAFTATASVKNGAKVTSYNYNFGDGKTATVQSSTTTNATSHTYAKAGSYTAKVTVNFTADGKNTSDSCTVKVTVTPAPVYACVDLESKQLSRTEFAFTTTANVQNGAKVTGYGYDFGDGENASVQSTSTTNLTNHTYAEAGTYQVKATVHFTAEGKDTSDSCTTKVIVLGQTEACNTETHQIETVTKGQENTPPYTTDVSQCEKIKVCDTTQTPPVIISIYPNEMREGYKDVDSAECHPTPKPPVTPELPETGITEGIASILGLGSLSAATFYYIASRRS